VEDDSHAVLQVTRSINDPGTEYDCAECGAEAIRSFSPFSINFKGNGFYKTDNAK